MSISSTGIYGSSYLSEDVEQLKIDVTSLTASHLSVTTNHDGRLDILETDNTSNKINITSNTTRIGDLETDNTSNITRIVTLETDVTDNTTRIVDLETDNTSNISRIVTLETDVTDNTTRIVDLEDNDSNHILRLDDIEAQIFDVVHEPNKYEEEFFYGFYPVPYDVLEAYSQLFYSKSLTLKDKFDESTTTDLKDVIKVIQEILQTHEMKIVNIEFFNTLSEAKAAAQFLWATGKYVNNKFGKKIIQKLFPTWSSMSNLSYDLLLDITDKTLNEVIDELDNLNTIFKYENSTFGDKGGIKATKIYFTPSIENIFVESTITETVNDITFTSTKPLNKYLDIKDNHPIDRVTDKITLKYDTTQFQTGAATPTVPATSYQLELKNIMGKVDVKDNHPITKIADKLTLNYDTTQFQTGAATPTVPATSYQLELKNIMGKVDVKDNHPITKISDKLTLNYDTTQFQTGAATPTVPATSYQLELKNIMGKVDVKDNHPITKIADKLTLNYDTTHFKTGTVTTTPTTSYKLELNDIMDKVKIKTSGGISKDTNGIYQTFQIDQLDYNTLEKTSTVNDPNKLSVKLHSSSSGLEASSGLKINLYPLTSGLELTSTGLKINTGLNSGLTLAADGLSINPTYKTELTTLKTQAQTAATASETAKDAAILARNAAQASQSAALGSAEAAAASATTAGTQASAALGSAGAAGTSAGAAGASALAAEGSAGAAAASALAAGGSAAAAGTSAGAAALSALGAAGAVLLGLSGKADAYHYHSQYYEISDFSLNLIAVASANNSRDLAWDTKLDARWKLNADTSIYFDTLANPLRRVGIGKADPSTLLDVNGTINATGFTLNGTAFTGGTNGTNGKGWTGATYSATTGKVSFASTDGVPYVFDTGDLRGGAGANGKGWTGATYNATTGKVSFASNDGTAYVFDTGDLRGGTGANGKGWTGATYSATTGKVSFASNDGTAYVFDTGDLRGGTGANGKGWTGATYSATTGAVTFASNDVGYALTTGDLRGTSGPPGPTGPQGPQGIQGIQGIQGLTGASGVISGNLDVTNITSTFLTTTRTSGIRNSSYPMSFENICSPTNFIKTTGVDTATNKIVYTTSGIYRLYASTVASSNGKIENIFDANVSTSWTTSANSYTKLTSTSAYTHSTFSYDVIGLGLIYGEWIKIRFPRKCYVKDVFYTPFSLATSITEGYLLGSNNEFDWEPVYPINKTFTNLNESSLLTVGGFLASIYTGTDKAYQYFTLVATKIQGTSGAAANSTEKLAITNLRFTIHESWIYNDNIISVGTFPSGTPVSNAIDVNGNAYVSGQIITEGGINVLSGQLSVVGTSTLTGNVGVGKAPHATYKLDVLGTLNTTSLLVGGNPITASKWTNNSVDATKIYYNGGNVGIGTTDPLALLDVVKPTAVATATDIINLRFNADWGLKLQQNYTGAGNIQYDFIHRYSSVNYNLLTFKGANVGIGNTNPTGTLCLGNSQLAGSDGFLLIGKNNGGGGARTQRIGYNSEFYLTIGDYGGGTGAWVEAFKLSYAAPANSLVINGGGYVGIGTTPSYKTHLKCGYDNVNTGLHLDADDGSNNPNKYALTIWPFVIGGGQVGWRFRTLSLDGGNTTPLEFRHNGTLRVMADRFHESSEGETRLYFATSATTYIRGAGSYVGISIVFRSPTQFDMAYFNASVFCCYGPVNLSDRRIKRDIEEINDDDALNKILLVQPTTYYYRDETRNRGNGKVYGFIAQQIKEVIPDAVHTTKEIIANIYKTCLVYNKREIYHSIPQDVAIDTEVHILDKEGGEKGKRYKIKEIYDDYFVIDEDIDAYECFVFGYCVDDLNALDKSYIYTLNVCATQELHRRMEAQNVIIKSQDERIKELEIKIEKLMNYISI